jgi:glycosyltransferase involved in cell wall biosynthesis
VSTLPEAPSQERPSPPSISIVLPSRDRLRFLRPTIESVFAQTYTNWELLIADASSDEETRGYLRVLEGDSRVRLIRLAPTGPGPARNAALRQASGDYVAFLDSDDLWAPRKLERQIEALRALAGCRWCFTAYSQVDAAGEPLSRRVQPSPAFDASLTFEELARTGGLIATSSVLASRQLLAQEGGFDESLSSAEDYDLWMRVAVGNEPALVREPLVQKREHDENLSGAWQGAFASRERTLVHLQGMVNTERRALLRRERAMNALSRAAAHSSARDYGEVWSALSRSFPYSWVYAGWWVRGVKILLRPHVPRHLLEAYRAHRHR